jgi:ABC-type phosphate/phosphonate transport system substrate-binding protein
LKLMCWACAAAAAALCCLALVEPAATAEPSAAAPDATLTLVVMDPLALPLSCPCVQGYAQRDYEKLASALETALGRKIHLVFNESLTAALRGQAQGRAHLIIGKHSVVLFDAQKNNLELTQLAMLTGKDGGTTQTGLFVVPSHDPAKTVADIEGYRIIFGPAESDEKHAAALALLKQLDVPAPQTIETAVACDEGANLVLELPAGQHGAAVISSYAKPLLEGCGTVKKGDLKVIGETLPVPFVAAFATGSIKPEERQALLDALVAASSTPEMRIALETRRGFVPIEPPGVVSTKKK